MTTKNEKISKALTEYYKTHKFHWSGKKQSKEHSEKRRLANLGKKRSLEQRKAMSLRLIGSKRHTKPHTEETKKKLSSIRGERTSNWKGGVTILNKAVRNLIEYKQWRLKVYKKDGWKCSVCGLCGGWDKEKRKYTRLEADHIKPLSLLIIENKINNHEEARNCKDLFDINNGRTLCKECHKKTDTYMVKAQKITKSYKLVRDSLFDK